MSTNADQLEKLKQALAEMKGFNLELITRPGLPEKETLAAAHEYLWKIQNTYGAFYEERLGMASDDMIVAILEELEHDNARFSTLSKMTSDDIEASRTQIIHELNRRQDNITNKLHTFISFFKANDSHIERLTIIEKQAKSLRDDVSTVLKDSQVLLESIRGVSSEAGVSNQSSYFSDEADAQKSALNMWGLGIIISAFIFLVISITLIFVDDSRFYNKISSTAGSNQTEGIFQQQQPITSTGYLHWALKFAGGRFLIVAVLCYLVVFCAKNFTVHKHNYIVNKHRANALKSYLPIVLALKDQQEVRDVILKSAADAIFSHQSTGCSPSAGEHGQSSSPDLLIKTIFNKAQ